ncbi:ALF repeat-containing protein (plasmid) [Streptomyces sp. NBC_01426]|uniref:ALF repeat-containing protein n=1 Tax=Streptomyces sp. NBC_01426 TaxID=2975866 RepID=UPI002E2F67B1|nr:ALF repeat-containing protein [Streptomyces sp. NBC_01426]
MKLSRIAAAVTTAALAPVVLISSPAFAAGPDASVAGNPPAPTVPDRVVPDQAAPGRADEDRKTILAIIADPMASGRMKEAGHKAIAAGPAAMREFIETEQYEIRRVDYRIHVIRLLNGAGPGLEGGIMKLLDGNATLAQLRHFYEVTQHELRDEDNQVDISRLIGTAGPGVKEAAKKALKGTPADRVAFLKTGRYLAQASDDRVELARIDEAWDGPILSEAISKLLRGTATPAQLREFLEKTQYELRDQDNRVTIAKIIDGGGPELVKAGRAALAGTAADRVAFLATGRHEASARDKKAQQENDKNQNGQNQNHNGGQNGNQNQNNSGNGSHPGTDTKPGTGKPNTGTNAGNTAVTAQGSSGSSLAGTGAGDGVLIAGGAGTALVAGAGLLLAARMRRAGSAR